METLWSLSLAKWKAYQIGFLSSIQVLTLGIVSSTLNNFPSPPPGGTWLCFGSLLVQTNPLLHTSPSQSKSPSSSVLQHFYGLIRPCQYHLVFAVKRQINVKMLGFNTAQYPKANHPKMPLQLLKCRVYWEKSYFRHLRVFCTCCSKGCQAFVLPVKTNSWHLERATGIYASYAIQWEEGQLG